MPCCSCIDEVGLFGRGASGVLDSLHLSLSLYGHVLVDSDHGLLEPFLPGLVIEFNWCLARS